MGVVTIIGCSCFGFVIVPRVDNVSLRGVKKNADLDVPAVVQSSIKFRRYPRFSDFHITARIASIFCLSDFHCTFHQQIFISLHQNMKSENISEQIPTDLME